MRGHERDDDHRQQQHVVGVHLAEVQDVEERSDAGRVQPVLRLRRDPLGVEVLLGDVAGERGDDPDQERDDAGHPRPAAPAAPGGHEELTPEVDDHKEEEQLHRPEVDAVDEVSDAGVVPPGRSLQAEDHARGDDDHQRRDRQHTEQVDPRRHVDRLAVGQQLLRRHRAHAGFPQAHRPVPAAAHDSLRRRLPGKGRRIAAKKTMIINTITTMLDTDMSKKCQCT